MGQPFLVAEYPVQRGQRTAGAGHDFAEPCVLVALFGEYLGGGVEESLHPHLTALAQVHRHSRTQRGYRGRGMGAAVVECVRGRSHVVGTGIVAGCRWRNLAKKRVKPDSSSQAGHESRFSRNAGTHACPGSGRKSAGRGGRRLSRSQEAFHDPGVSGRCFQPCPFGKVAMEDSCLAVFPGNGKSPSIPVCERGAATHRTSSLWPESRTGSGGRARWYIWHPCIPGKTDLADHIPPAATSLSKKLRTQVPVQGSGGRHGRGDAR